MQRLLASARALGSNGSSASIAEPLHEAEEKDHVTMINVFGLQKRYHGCDDKHDK
jgi:hypothetical protein